METVTQNQVLTQEELQLLKTIQDETQALVMELGEIELTIIHLENRKEKAKDFLKDLTNQEQEFTTSVFEKYGKVNIDPETGEITKLD
jgi:ribosome-binding ATPase YchF (GTP1/OBG family)